MARQSPAEMDMFEFRDWLETASVEQLERFGRDPFSGARVVGSVSTVTGITTLSTGPRYPTDLERKHPLLAEVKRLQAEAKADKARKWWGYNLETEQWEKRGRWRFE